MTMNIYNYKVIFIKRDFNLVYIKLSSFKARNINIIFKLINVII